MIAAAVLFGAPVAVASGDTGIIPPKNPPKSIPPHPDFQSPVASACFGQINSSADCERMILRAIAYGRRKEHLGPMKFDLAAFRKLTDAEQLFVTVDLERTARREKPVEGLSEQLDGVASRAAHRGQDPSVSLPYRLRGGGVVMAEGGNSAGDTENVLGSSYYWVYDDGPRSPNGLCSARYHYLDCWGHRDNILSDAIGKHNWAQPSYCRGASGSYHLVMGAASTRRSTSGSSPSQTELFALDCGRAPSEYFTWKQAKRLLGIR